MDIYGLNYQIQMLCERLINDHLMDPLTKRLVQAELDQLVRDREKMEAAARRTPSRTGSSSRDPSL